MRGSHPEEPLATLQETTGCSLTFHGRGNGDLYEDDLVSYQDFRTSKVNLQGVHHGPLVLTVILGSSF